MTPSTHSNWSPRQVSRSPDIGTAISKKLNRKSLQGSVELRPPALDRIFNRECLGRKWKHVIEPRITYDYVTGVDNFAQVLRFDDRDILSDTNEVEYAIVNRLYAKRTSDNPEDCGSQRHARIAGGRSTSDTCPLGTPCGHEQPCHNQPGTREIITWELTQKYFLDPTFGGRWSLGGATFSPAPLISPASHS